MTCTNESGVHGVSYHAWRRLMVLKSLVFSSSTNKIYTRMSIVNCEWDGGKDTAPFRAFGDLCPLRRGLHLLALQGSAE